MTKLDFKTCKSEGLNEEQYQANATNNTIINSINNEEQQKKDHFESVLTTLGLNVKQDGTDRHIGFSCIGIDWTFILQVANAQAILSVLLIICLTSSMFLIGYRFISSAWATYLLFSAYIGMKAGRWQSYPHAVAYCGICIFQSFIYLSTMCLFFYSLYTPNLSTQSYEFIHSTTSDAALIFTLGEVLCVMGTCLTGIFGLIGCCRGFGRLLHAQEKMILDYQNVLMGAYDCARRLNTI